MGNKEREDALELLQVHKDDLSIASYDRIAGLIGDKALDGKALSEESLLLLIAIETRKSNYPGLVDEVMRRLDASPKKDLPLKKRIGLTRSK